jgi:hypothetical protein
MSMDILAREFSIKLTALIAIILLSAVLSFNKDVTGCDARKGKQIGTAACQFQAELTMWKRNGLRRPFLYP